MSEKNPPAFPALNFVVPADLEARHVARLGETRGMTLRDYFAAKVLPVAMANFYGDVAADGCAWDGHDDVAEHCYLVADAMLKARAE